MNIDILFFNGESFRFLYEIGEMKQTVSIRKQLLITFF